MRRDIGHIMKKPKKSKSFINRVDKLFKSRSINALDRMIMLYYLNEFDFISNSDKFN